MASYSTTIGVSANQSSPGDPVDFDEAVVSSCTITNNSGISVQFSLDGSSWTTVVNGGTASPTVSTPTAFRLRKTTGDSYPVGVDMAWSGSAANASSGGVPSTSTGSSTITLDATVRQYTPLTVVGATVITVGGSTSGASSSMVVLADGTNIPTISGADEWASSFGYLNTAGIPNRLDVWHDGVARRYAWSQQATPAAIDLVAPVFSSAAVNAATLTMTYGEALNTTAPAASAFSVVGAGGVTQNPSSVGIVGTVVTLTLTTPAVQGNTVTVSYTPPGVNPLQDAAGNQSVALSGQAVTNSTATPVILELTNLAKLTQGSGGTDNVYVADGSGVTSFGAYGRGGLTLAGDGWVSVDWASGTAGAVTIGFDRTNTIDWSANNDTTCPDYYLHLSTTSGNLNQGSNTNVSTLVGTALTPSATARYRLRRTGTSVTIDESNDSGGNWSMRYTFGPASTGTLYVIVATVQSNTFYRPRQVGLA